MWGKHTKLKCTKTEELNKWGDSMFVDERFNIIKISILPNLIYRFNSIPIKTSARYFVDMDNLKFTWRGKTLAITNQF